MIVKYSIFSGFIQCGIFKELLTRILVLWHRYYSISFYMRGSRKKFQWGPTYGNVFLYDEGGKIQIPLKVGYYRPVSKCPLNDVSLAG